MKKIISLMVITVLFFSCSSGPENAVKNFTENIAIKSNIKEAASLNCKLTKLTDPKKKKEIHRKMNKIFLEVQEYSKEDQIVFTKAMDEAMKNCK